MLATTDENELGVEQKRVFPAQVQWRESTNEKLASPKFSGPVKQLWSFFNTFIEHFNSQPPTTALEQHEQAPFVFCGTTDPLLSPPALLGELQQPCL